MQERKDEASSPWKHKNPNLCERRKPSAEINIYIYIYATCGSRLLQLNHTAMDEGLIAGSTIHVLRRLRGGARAGGVGVGSAGSEWYAVLIGVGLPVPAVIGVINHVVPPLLAVVARQHMSLCWSLDAFPFPRIIVVLLLLPVLRLSLGWCSVPSFRPLLLRVARFLRQPGRLVSATLHLASRPPLLMRVLVFSRPVLQLALLGVKNTMAPLPPSSSQCGPSFGPSQASVMNALAFLSNVLIPVEVDSLRKLLDPPPPPPLPQPAGPSNDQPAMWLAATMQHQEQLKKQVDVLQQRVVDAETKLLQQEELLGETERIFVMFDCSIADLRKRIWPSPRVSLRFQSVDEEMFSAEEDQESKRTRVSTCGNRRDFMVGCTLAAAAEFACKVEPGSWITPHLAVRTHFDCGRWTRKVTQPVQRTPLWPTSWLAAVDKSRGSESAEVHALLLDES